VAYIAKQLHKHPGKDTCAVATLFAKKVESALSPSSDNEAILNDLRSIKDKAASLDADV
jgi:hypothetical protein